MEKGERAFNLVIFRDDLECVFSLVDHNARNGHEGWISTFPNCRNRGQAYPRYLDKANQ